MTPERTLERLIIYRLILEKLKAGHVASVFSGRIAEVTGNTPAQVRRDLMEVGAEGNPKSGYDVDDLLEKIQNMLEPADGIPMVLVGIGNLGRAIMGYFSSMRPRFNLVAAFDVDDSKTGRVVAGCRCYPLKEIRDVLQNRKVQVGIIAVPGAATQKAADLLVEAGVKGLVHFDTEPITVPDGVYLENMRMNLMFEKVAFFVRQKEQEDQR